MNVRSARSFWIALSAVVAGVLAVTAWEFAAFGWHPAREEHAAFGSYHLGRMAVCAIGAAVLVALLERFRVRRAVPAIPAGGIAAVAISLSLVLSLSFVAVFVAHPPAFHLLASEDHAIEWVSALLLFAGCALFLAGAASGHRALARLDLLLCLALAGGYFIMAMEEISWMQRVIGYGTPEAVAERNWQGEFNLHNFQTDIAELLFYTATGAFLILLPLLAEAIPNWKPLVWFRTFVPGRTTAAVSAPMLLFTYGQWNLLPVQLVCFAGLFALLAFARQSRLATDRALFHALAAVVALGGAAFLVLGHSMLDVPDASEFKELFIALGLASFAVEFWRRTSKARA